jgi:hypothetical protein
LQDPADVATVAVALSRTTRNRCAVAYVVRFNVDLDTVPDRGRQEIRRTMQQIAEAVTTVPAASPFWSSMKESLLQIDVEGWRVIYAIDPSRERIEVVELHQLRK